MENKKFIITIIILVVIILGLGGFIAVDKLVLNKKEEKITTQVGDVQLNLTAFEHINDTIDLFNRAFNDPNSKYYGYLYTKREINVSNFDKSAAIYVSMYDSFIDTTVPLAIPGGVVKTKY